MSEKKLTKEEWRRLAGEMVKKPPLQPGRGRVLVVREPSTNVLSEIQTDRGTVELHGADAYQEPAQRGIVICVGAPKLTMMGGPIPFWVQAGQLVTFPQYSGKQYNLGAAEAVILDEEEILAAIPRD